MSPNSNQSPDFRYDGIAIVRILMGLFFVAHGWQDFAVSDHMAIIDHLVSMSLPFPEAMAYTAQVMELIGGLFLILGLFTRVISFFLIVVFVILTFVTGNGKIFTDDHNSFLYGLIALTFLFTGAGRFSVDYILSLNRSSEQREQNIEVSKRFGRYVSKS